MKIKGKQKRRLKREAIRAGLRLARSGKTVDAESIAEEMAVAGLFASGDLAGFDWEQLIELIQKWLPLILRIVLIFV